MGSVFVLIFTAVCFNMFRSLAKASGEPRSPDAPDTSDASGASGASGKTSLAIGEDTQSYYDDCLEEDENGDQEESGSFQDPPMWEKTSLKSQGVLNGNDSNDSRDSREAYYNQRWQDGRSKEVMRPQSNLVSTSPLLARQSSPASACIDAARLRVKDQHQDPAQHLELKPQLYVATEPKQSTAAMTSSYNHALKELRNSPKSAFILSEIFRPKF